ncbi:unnamed protein product, partial [Rhizoctonia solani]
MSINPPGLTSRNPNQSANPAPVANPPSARSGDGRRQLCKFFNGGGCKYATTCRYLHVPTGSEGDARPLSQPHPARKNRTPNLNFPGLSNDQFSKVLLNQTAGKTFNALQPFVSDSFRFKIPDQVYLFLNLLCTASCQNTAGWTANEAQTLLHKLVQGNGIIRLAEAMRFPKETTRAWSFQRGYIPIFTYLASDWVVKRGMRSEVNALYGLVHNQFRTIREVVEANVGKLMAARSFEDPLNPSQLSGKQVFKVIFVTIFQYITRFHDATITNPSICDFAEQMADWFDEWVVALESDPPFQDELVAYNKDDREFIIENLQSDKEQILRLKSYEPPSDASDPLLAELERVFEYDGPGDHSETGRPRHDNDHTEIDMIQVIPTSDELLCEADPYLPGNFFEAPHYHDPRSIERLLDIQYRLYREEFMSSVRLAVQHVVADLKKSGPGIDVLTRKLNPRSGLYVTANGRDSIRFSVFTGITFQPLELNTRGISSGIDFDTPPGKAKSYSSAARAAHWEQISKKQLMQDGLVVLAWKTPAGKVDVYLGTVASSGQDLISPGFSFELKELFPSERGVETLRLTTRNSDSIAHAKAELVRASRLDPSQAEAVIHALTREVVLIQGPPGTGKSYTGLELIRVLIKNGICPILLVAFTNHALDHMLTGILDAEITNNMIRLGSRSTDERLSPYLLNAVGRISGKSPLAASRKEAAAQLKELESQMDELMKDITSHNIPSSHIEEHISYMYPHHHGELFRHTPTWIDAIVPKQSDSEEGWEIAGESPNQQSMIDYWLGCGDLKFLESQGRSAATTKASAHTSGSNRFNFPSDSDSDSDDELETFTRKNFLRDFMREHGLNDIPKVPNSNRPLHVLQKN